MGCDIHLYRERKIKGKWTTLDNWSMDDDYFEVPYKERFTDRNYNLFGLMCDGVRGSYPFSLKGRGMPNEYSEEVHKSFEQWRGDGHSHSYLTVTELIELRNFIKSQTIKITGQKDIEELVEFKRSIESENPDWKLLYPYCKWSSSPNDVDFEIDVPAEFIIGKSLDKIIDMFDTIEDSRVVFWFDN